MNLDDILPIGEHYYLPDEIPVKDSFLSIVTKVTVTQVAIMKFYGREYELNVLNDIFSQCSNSYGKITVLTGRRRIGKTLLAKEYARGKDALYLFTSKKTEKLLCEEFLPLYEELTGERYIGVIERFVEIFELFMKWGMKKPFVLIIDEFRSFLRLTQVFFQRFNIYGIPISLKRKYIYFSLVQSIQ